jgi:ABC-2 type transport system permease protein
VTRSATFELLGRALSALRRSVMWWTLAITALALTTAAAWPGLEGSEALQSFEDMGALLEAFGATNLSSPSGYLDGQMYALMLPLLLSAMAIAVTSNLTSGDEDAGRLEFLLALPVSRRAVWLCRFAAAAMSVIGVAAAVTVGMIGLRPLFSLHEVGVVRIATATAGAAALALFCAAIAYAAGGAGASRGRAIGIAALVLVTSYVMTFIAPLVAELEGIRRWSPWYWALGEQPVSDGVDAVSLTFVIAVGIMLVIFGTLRVQRRDIRSA